MADAALDWNLPPRTPLSLRAAAVALVMAVLAASLGVAVAALVGQHLAVGAVAGAVIFVAYVASRPRAALRRFRARRASADSHARLVSLVRGLSDDLGVRQPQAWVYDGEGLNAFACGAGKGAIAISTSAVSSLDRTQLEALVAHCLVRVSTGAARTASLASIAPPAAAAAGAIVDHMDDARAAALTRYPPAVAACLQRVDPQSGRFAPFFFVASGPSHEPIDRRIAALADL